MSRSQLAAYAASAQMSNIRAKEPVQVATFEALIAAFVVRLIAHFVGINIEPELVMPLIVAAVAMVRSRKFAWSHAAVRRLQGFGQ